MNTAKTKSTSLPLTQGIVQFLTEAEWKCDKFVRDEDLETVIFIVTTNRGEILRLLGKDAEDIESLLPNAIRLEKIKQKIADDTEFQSMLKKYGIALQFRPSKKAGVAVTLQSPNSFIANIPAENVNVPNIKNIVTVYISGLLSSPSKQLISRSTLLQVDTLADARDKLYQHAQTADCSARVYQISKPSSVSIEEEKTMAEEGDGGILREEIEARMRWQQYVVGLTCNMDVIVIWEDNESIFIAVSRPEFEDALVEEPYGDDGIDANTIVLGLQIELALSQADIEGQLKIVHDRGEIGSNWTELHDDELEMKTTNSGIVLSDNFAISNVVERLEILSDEHGDLIILIEMGEAEDDDYDLDPFGTQKATLRIFMRKD